MAERRPHLPLRVGHALNPLPRLCPLVDCGEPGRLLERAAVVVARHGLEQQVVVCGPSASEPPRGETGVDRRDERSQGERLRRASRSKRDGVRAVAAMVPEAAARLGTAGGRLALECPERLVEGGGVAGGGAGEGRRARLVEREHPLGELGGADRRRVGERIKEALRLPLPPAEHTLDGGAGRVDGVAPRLGWAHAEQLEVVECATEAQICQIALQIAQLKVEMAQLVVERSAERLAERPAERPAELVIIERVIIERIGEERIALAGVVDADRVATAAHAVGERAERRRARGQLGEERFVGHLTGREERVELEGLEGLEVGPVVGEAAGLRGRHRVRGRIRRARRSRAAAAAAAAKPAGGLPPVAG